jgi:citrate synthase
MKRLELLAGGIVAGGKSTLTIRDTRTDKTYEVPVSDNSVKGSDLQKIVENGKVLRSYDPGYMNTILCTSKISYIDGDKGILEYRGYPIEELAEKSTFMEVSFLLLFGELPTASQLQAFQRKVMSQTFVHSDVNDMMKSFRYDAHPMGMFCSTVAALSTLHPEQNPSLAG